MKVRPRYKLAALGVVLTLVLAACSTAASPTPTSLAVDDDTPLATRTPDSEPSGPLAGGDLRPTVVPAATPTRALTQAPTPTSESKTIEDLWITTFDVSFWETNCFKHSIDCDDVLQAQSKDGIPSIDEPEFEDFAGAEDWLGEDVPVLALEINGDARAYPLGILIWNEIVNDIVGGTPVAVTYCPLCNAAIVMKWAVVGLTLQFGVSGNLRNSDLIMYDR